MAVQTVQPSKTTAASQSDAPRALLIGASRGLGLGLAKLFAARGWDLVATERGASAGLEAAAGVAARRFRIEHLDITNHDEIAELHRALSGELFDVIFIVAGVHDDTTKPIHAVPVAEVARLFITNAYSPIYLAEVFFDLLKPQGTLAIMSSRMGSVSLAASYTPGEWEPIAPARRLSTCWRAASISVIRMKGARF
jgi:NAD(P)-dependent dehydrogenase (short-subunit alcohol dehydrogenase family)